MEKNNKYQVKFSMLGITPPELPKMGSRLSGNYWTWGEDNKFPNYLYTLYEDSGLHGSIIKSKHSYVKGRGLKTDSVSDDLKSFIGKVNRHGDTLEDILERYILDVLIYGAGALNVVWNRAGDKIAELYYLDVAQCRYSKDKSKLIYNDDWTKGLRSNTVEYPLFDLDNRKGSQVYHYTSAQSKLLYSSPSYNGSILDIQAAINISKFHAAKTVHPMQSDLFIEFVGDEPEDEEKQEFEDGIKRKFTGLNNAGNSIMIGYVKSRDEATRIEAIPTSDPEGKRFLQLREEVKASIITGHQLPSTELLAIANTKTLAFDSGYDKAYEIFQAVFVRPLQEELMKPINRLLSINFPGTKLELLPLPVVKVNLTNEQFIYENMTTEEVRADLLKAGRIDKAEYEPGSLNKEQNGKEPGSIDQAIISTIKKTKEDAA